MAKEKNKDLLIEKRLELEKVQKYAEGVVTRLRSGHATTQERAELEPLTEKAEALASEIGAIEDDIELYAKIARVGSAALGKVDGPLDGGDKYRDVVDMFMRSDSFRSVVEHPENRQDKWATEWIGTDFKAAPVDPSSANPADLVPQILPGIIAPFTFPLKVGALFSQGNMTGSSLSFLSVATADGQADMTAIASAKAGPATATIDIDNVPARKVTGTMTLPEEALEDLPAVESQIRNLLLVGPNGLAEKLEDQYLNGTGNTNDMAGVLSLTPDDATLAGERVSKSIFNAAMSIENETGFAADAFVMNPADYFGYYTEEDLDERPLWGSWGAQYGGDQSGGPRGLTPVTSRKIAAGTVLVGAFKASTRFVRKSISIRASAEGLGLADFNLVLFVAEARELLQHPYGKSPFRTVTVSS